MVEAASAFWSCSVISHPRWGIKSLAEPTDTVTMVVMIIMVAMVFMVTKVIRDNMVLMVEMVILVKMFIMLCYQSPAVGNLKSARTNTHSHPSNHFSYHSRFQKVNSLSYKHINTLNHYRASRPSHPSKHSFFISFTSLKSQFSFII